MEPSFWRDKKVFLTGNSGFKGAWLSTWLSMFGAMVYGWSLPDRIETGERFLREMEYSKPDIVIHMAAQAFVKKGYADPLNTIKTNVWGTARLLDQLRYIKSVKATLIVTSDKVYAWNGEPHVETDPVGGHDPYSASKACASLLTSCYRDSYGLNIAEARAGNVIGGGDWGENRIIPDIINALKENRPLTLRCPNAVRPWQHVLDCLNGYLMLIESLYDNPHNNRPFNFGPDDCNVTVLDVVQYFKCPYTIEPGDFKERGVLLLDNYQAKEALGWKPKLSTYEALDWTKAGYDGKTMREQIEEFMKL